MKEPSPIALVPPSAPTAPSPGWFRDGFLWRLRWGAEWRTSKGDHKRAKAIIQAIRSQAFNRFATYFFAIEQGRCRCAIRPIFDPVTGLEIPHWSQPLPFEMCFEVQRGSFRGQRAVLGVERLTGEQMCQIDAGASLVLAGFSAHFARDTRVALDAPQNLFDPGDLVYVERLSAKRARERGVGLSELAHAKGVAGKMLGIAATYYQDWPDGEGRQFWTKLTPRVQAVRALAQLITGTALTDAEVQAIWNAAEQEPPFHPIFWPFRPNSKT
jgi:hypothetical protein